MSERRTLKILQYNVNHGKEATLIPLLQDTEIRDFDILAVQEPWRNPYIHTGYNPSSSNFYLVYPALPGTRVCFYINKRLHPDSWSVTSQYEDLLSIAVRIKQGERVREIRIHNVYNPSPQSYTAVIEGTLTLLRETLRGDADDHVVIGDFNLHHPFWSGLARPTQHAAADILLEIARESSLELVTP